MPSITDTIRRLRAEGAAGLAKHLPTGLTGDEPRSPRLQRLASFGSNPGALAGWYYVPAGSEPVALVVVLHGCTQTAAGYDHGSGWSDLAERFGFAVLLPEQQRANNPNLCFNWFQAEDTRRGGGEALSIRQMVAALVRDHPIDAGRVFVTGLSAGGAMTDVMLATYPEVFAGGSIIAGLPYGVAGSVPEALERMRGVGLGSATAGADRVRAASPHRGRWPTITVWHGEADRTVAVANADAVLGQWREVHGLANRAARVETVDGQRHRVWLDGEGGIAVEDYRISGLGHGTPLKTSGADGCGHAGPFMLEAGISSTWRQAERWGLIDRARICAGAPAAVAPASAAAEPEGPSPAGQPDGVGAVIERALRSAGLMR